MSLFDPPDNENVKIWRYMDYTKFMSLVINRELYFTPADLLGDEYEGSLPKLVASEKYSKSPDQDLARTIHMNMRKAISVSCWHMNDSESTAMWQLYAEMNKGIAMQSTYKRLRECLAPFPEVRLAIAKYIDYDTESFDYQDPLMPFIHKRQAFSHEQELRALAIQPERIETARKQKYPFDSQRPVRDRYIGDRYSVNLSDLIETIYVAPNIAPWIVYLTCKILEERNIKSPVICSDLDKAPLF